MSQLYGPPNPKTLIPPIIAPPIADFETWRDSSRAPNNYVNVASPIFYSQESGYAPSIEAKPAKIKRDNVDTIDLKAVSNIPAYHMQALAGPNSWTATIPQSTNSNIGISQMPQFGHVTNYGSAGGDYQIFVETLEPVLAPDNREALQFGEALREILMSPSPQNVYDPRAYGYGPTNRIKIDPASGIPSYEYKDVDNARRTNYLSRTNLNFELNNAGANDAKLVAQEKYIMDTNNSRLKLQESLMRKRNAELWQRKVAPINPSYIR